MTRNVRMRPQMCIQSVRICKLFARLHMDANATIPVAAYVTRRTLKVVNCEMLIVCVLNEH